MRSDRARSDETFAPVAPRPARADETFAPLPPRADAPVAPPPRADTFVFPASRAAPGGGGDALDDADVDVEALEIHLRRPAGWRRAASWIVDAVPFVALFAFGVGALRGMTTADGLIALWQDVVLGAGDAALALPVLAGVAILAVVYHLLCHALAGATLGKWMLGLRVVGPDGRRPTLGRSAARGVLTVVSVLLLGLGLLLALFTRSGRALHDLVARTWVVEAP